MDDCNELYPMDKLFNNLVFECNRNVKLPLSISLKNELEKYSRTKRKQIVSRMTNNCAPLFIACKKNNIYIVNYLLEICDADIEQRGKMKENSVTPLWYATYMSHLTMINCLVSHGANINVQINGYTLIHMKCLSRNIDFDKLEIISYLVQHGADISKTNVIGQTCLMNSVHDVNLCSFLLANGANVNATDNNNNTALHYAVKRFNLATVQLLLKHNIDPYVKNSFNNDALLISCLKVNTVAFKYLTTNILYSPEVLADANELIGSIFYLKNESEKVSETFQFWQEAISIRHTNLVNGMPLPKKPVLSKCEVYENATEFSTLEDLNIITQDLNATIMQCFLICERVCGKATLHNNIISLMISAARLYLKSQMYQKCVNLLYRALQIEIENGQLLSTQTSIVIQDILWIMINYVINNQIKSNLDCKPINYKLRCCDVLEVYKLISKEIMKTESSCIYAGRSNSEGVSDFSINRFMVLRYIVQIFYVLIEISSDEEKNLIYETVSPLVKYNPKIISGQTFLHFCIYNNNNMEVYTYSNIYNRNVLSPMFSNVKIIKMLLKCGASVNDKDDFLQSPLHLACMSYCNETVQLLLDYGAHLDMKNEKGETPLQMLRSFPKGHNICVTNYMTLQCYAAQTICKYNICTEKLSTILCKFVDLHR